MRIRGKSKLDPYAEKILKLRKRGKTIEEILSALKINVGYTTLRDWLCRREDGEASQELSHTVQPSTAKQSPVSLGLLDALSDAEQFAVATGGLRIFWYGKPDWSKLALKDALEGVGIPSKADGEPDFAGFAKILKRERVKTLGDMDYVVLAFWTREIRSQMPGLVHRIQEGGFVRRQLRPVFLVAKDIRGEMLTAVGLAAR